MSTTRANAPVPALSTASSSKASRRSRGSRLAFGKAEAAGLLLVTAVVTSACGGKLAAEPERASIAHDAGAQEPSGPLDECGAFARAHAVFTKTCRGYDEPEPSLAKSCRDLLALPGTSLTLTDVVECAAAVENGMPTCALPPCSGYGSRAVSPIEKSAGTLPSGSSCLVDHQCVSGECRVEYGKTCGTCLKTRFIRQSCNPPHEPCFGGMQCINGTCEDGGKNLGEACDASNACAWDLHCDAGPSGAVVCAQRRENGEPCSKADECMYRYCDKTQGKCAGHPPVGTSCTWADEAPCGWSGVQHCSSEVCEWTSVHEGGDCSEAPCIEGMRCIDNVCRKPAGTGLGLGERCYEMYCAAGLACAYVPCSSGASSCYDRICVSKQPGDTCSETCSPGAVCDGATCRKVSDRGEPCRANSTDCLEHLACFDGRCVGYEASLCR